MLSTYARNDNQGERRRTAVLRRQSDDSSRIDRDALGRGGGGDEWQFVRWSILAQVTKDTPLCTSGADR